MRRVVAAAARDVSPSGADAAKSMRLADRMVERVRGASARFPQVTGVHLGGSLAKGTWLAGDADADIFVEFEASVPKEGFEKMARTIGFEALEGYSPYVKYSEHPYVEAMVGRTRVNVVPFYRVRRGQWKSSADRSPYHTRHMKEHLTEKMRGDVRVLKAFLKANGLYGAEIARQGFSGYVAEVLVLRFGGFEGTVRAMAGARPGMVVGRAAKKFDTWVVITDPVDAKRNLAAAISHQNMARFALLCKAFLAGPSGAFFKRRRARASKELWGDLLVVSFSYRDRSPDMIWGQAKRAASSLARQLEMGGFRVLRRKAHVEKRAYLFFLLESGCIPRMYQKDGPEFSRAGGSEKFIGKNLDGAGMMWVTGEGRIAALKRRRHTDAAGFMRWFLRNNAGDVSRGLQADFARGIRVQLGARGLAKPAREAAGELVSTDGAFLYFG